MTDVVRDHHAQLDLAGFLIIYYKALLSAYTMHGPDLPTETTSITNTIRVSATRAVTGF